MGIVAMRKKAKLEPIDFLSHRSFVKVPIFRTLHNPQKASVAHRKKEISRRSILITHTNTMAGDRKHFPLLKTYN